MPTLTQLEYVLSVEKYRHFGKAAKACHISQPTLSQQIQKLEDDLSIVIFDRIQKPIVVTESGKRFIDQAKNVIREHQRLIHLTKQGSEGVSGEFRLAVIPTISSYLIPLFIQDFSKNFPNIDLYIEELKTDTILTELRNDKVDGAILATPLQQQGFKEHPLFYEPFDLYLSKDHPLLKKTTLSSTDLNSSEMWMLQDGNCFKTQVANFCSIGSSQDSVFKNIHFQSGSLDTLKHVIQLNCGYTMIPSLMTRLLDPSEAKAHVRSFKAPIPTREISFVYRRDHWKLEIINAIKSSITKCLPKNIELRPTSEQVILELC